jgi:hypothetical protein
MLKWPDIPWGTAITGIIAIYGAVLSTFNWRAQRHRDDIATREARRLQAERVTGWLTTYDGPEEPGELFYGLVLQNQSTQPVYNMIVSIVTVRGAGPRVGVDIPGRLNYRVLLLSLPPGQIKTRIGNPGQGMHVAYGVELAFRDSAGFYWVREANGTLRQADRPPGELYNISEPAPWLHAGQLYNE